MIRVVLPYHLRTLANVGAEVTVDVEGQALVLDVGDAVAFSGAKAHSYANPGTGPARFSLAVFEPGVGSGSRTEAAHA